MDSFTDIVVLGIRKWNSAFIRRQMWDNSTRGTRTRHKLQRLNDQITEVWGLLDWGWFPSALCCRLTNDFNLWLTDSQGKKEELFFNGCHRWVREKRKEVRDCKNLPREQRFRGIRATLCACCRCDWATHHQYFTLASACWVEWGQQCRWHPHPRDIVWHE